MRPALNRLYDRFAASIHGGRARLPSTVEGDDWRFTPRAGRLVLGGVELRAELLATESTATRTWLWAWANPGPGLSRQAVAGSAAVRAFGRDRGIDELTRPRLSTAGGDGDYLSTIAAGLLDAPAFFRGEADGSTAYLVVHESPGLSAGPSTPRGLVVDYLRAVSRLPILDHRSALLGLARDRGFEARGDARRVTFPGIDGGPLLVADFEGGRLARLELAESEPLILAP